MIHKASVERILRYILLLRYNLEKLESCPNFFVCTKSTNYSQIKVGETVEMGKKLQNNVIKGIWETFNLKSNMAHKSDVKQFGVSY